MKWHWQGGQLTNGIISYTVSEVLRLQDTNSLKEAKDSGVLRVIKSKAAFKAEFFSNQRWNRAKKGKALFKDAMNQ